MTSIYRAALQCKAQNLYIFVLQKVEQLLKLEYLYKISA